MSEASIDRLAGSGVPARSGVVIADVSAAVAALAPETGLIEDTDPVLFGRALAATVTAVAREPVKGVELTVRLVGELAGAGMAAVARAFGAATPGPLPVDGGDKRFADPAWETNPVFFAIRQAYLALGKYTLELARTARLEPSDAAKAEMVLGVLVDALAPTNFLVSNPAALKRAFDTGGRSVVAGLRNFADDVVHNGGFPRQVDTTPFEVGVNMAVTPARVVYRNDLMELLQYLPQTDRVHQVPILCSPPWINKYYVMDLAPGRSFIEWAVQHGHTVFAISYRNPDAAMAGTTLDDYLINGPRTALDVVCEITGSDTVHVVGLCLGGAMTMMTAAYLAGVGDDRVGTFDLLRANDLIFNYVVSNWLMGQSPPAFDILAWNADSTRMPAAMHSFYLRACYLENRFVAGELELAGRHLHLGDVKQPLYIVAAVNDHVVPWRSSYATTRYVPGPVRFVLSSGGHIAGIVNPPGPKAWYMTAEGSHASADAWRADADRHDASWWEDWAGWAIERGGPMIDPPPVGSAAHPVLGDGPGEYVHG